MGYDMLVRAMGIRPWEAAVCVTFLEYGRQETVAKELDLTQSRVSRTLTRVCRRFPELNPLLRPHAIHSPLPPHQAG